MIPRRLRVKFNKKNPAHGGWRLSFKNQEFLIKTKPSLLIRFAVNVGLNVAKKASRRNLLKRRIKGVILRRRELLRRLNKQDYLIKLLPSADNLDKKKLEEKFINALLTAKS